MKESFPIITEVSYLILVPLIYTLIIGFGILKLFNSKILNSYAELYVPVFGIALCVVFQITILKFNLILYAKPIYLSIAAIFLIYIYNSKKKVLSFDNEFYKKIIIGLLICLFILFTQRFTIGWGVVPLKYITESGFGMDDTAWHASIAGMFKNSLPIPHPTLCGETLPKSHLLVHCIAAFYSTLLNRNSLDIFFFTIPSLTILFLYFQVNRFLEIDLKKSKSTKYLGAIIVCLGLNGAFILFPLFGQNLVNMIPEPLPWIFWRLPGFGFSLLFALPLILIISKDFNQDIKPTLKYTLLFAILACGLYTKPAIPICIIGAYGLFGLSERFSERGFQFNHFLCSLLFSVIFYYFFLSAKTYGFNEQMPLKPFQTFNSVFEKVIASAEFLNNKTAKTTVFLGSYFLLPLYGVIKAIVYKNTLSEKEKVLLFTSALGSLAFIFLFSPMGAEYQFGLFAIFLGNILFFCLIKTNLERIITTCIFVVSFSLYLVHFANNSFSKNDCNIEKEVNRGIVESMNWLKDNSSKDEAFFINDQHYRSKMTNNAVYCALSERQSYISCFRYTPGTYLNLSKGDPSPWVCRLENNYRVFNGAFDEMQKIGNELNVHYLVINKNLQDLIKFDKNIKLNKAFENSNVAIYKIK